MDRRFIEVIRRSMSAREKERGRSMSLWGGAMSVPLSDSAMSVPDAVQKMCVRRIRIAFFSSCPGC